VGLKATTLIVGVGALRQSGRSLRRDPCHGSHPVVGGIVYVSGRSVFGQWAPYPWSPPCGVILLVRRGAGMVPDWTEVTVVTSVLEVLVWRACLQEAWLDLSLSLPGVMTGERSRI
jgi:hypothetical protein